MQEVTGSIPVFSTKSRKGIERNRRSQMVSLWPFYLMPSLLYRQSFLE
jgi:hypothetical protein